MSQDRFITPQKQYNLPRLDHTNLVFVDHFCGRDKLLIGYCFRNKEIKIQSVFNFLG
jgi:hypothetical protein